MSDDAGLPLPHLVAAAADGDGAALELIVAEYHDDMVRVAMVVCGDPDVAQEAVASAWPKVWKKIRSLRAPESLRPWLVSIAANEARQQIRQRSRRRRWLPLLADSDRSASSETGPDERVDFMDLARALSRLSADDRELIALRYSAELSSQQIASVRRTSSSAIRHRLARVRDLLRQDLVDE
jgi:RNA polymerase sigma-70 factor (ECF subfamily)